MGEITRVGVDIARSVANARMAWAVLVRGKPFDPHHVSATDAPGLTHSTYTTKMHHTGQTGSEHLFRPHC